MLVAMHFPTLNGKEQIIALHLEWLPDNHCCLHRVATRILFSLAFRSPTSLKQIFLMGVPVFAASQAKTKAGPEVRPYGKDQPEAFLNTTICLQRSL